jgi:hypothetical protein
MNEYLSKSLGFLEPHDALGHLLSLNGTPYTIVGVVADFNEGSFHSPITSVAILKQSESLRM